MTLVSNTELTPLSFLERSARVFPDKIAVVYGERQLTYRELAEEASWARRSLGLPARCAPVASGQGTVLRT